jgi:hypothetical protein
LQASKHPLRNNDDSKSQLFFSFKFLTIRAILLWWWHNSTRAGHNGAFQRLERGEVDLWSFYEAFSDQLSDPRNVAAYAKYAELRSKSTFHLRLFSSIDEDYISPDH